MPISSKLNIDVPKDDGRGPTRGEQQSHETRIRILEDRLMTIERQLKDSPTEDSVRKDLSTFRHWMTILEGRIDQLLMYNNVLQYVLLSLTVIAHPVLHLALKLVDWIDDNFKQTDDLLDPFLEKYLELMWTEHRRIQAQEARSLWRTNPSSWRD